MSARLRTSRSSAARAVVVAVLEDAKELLGAVDDRVGLLGLEPRAIVDPAPGRGRGKHARRVGGQDIEGRVANVGGRCGIGSEPLGTEQKRLRIRLVPF